MVVWPQWKFPFVSDPVADVGFPIHYCLGGFRRVHNRGTYPHRTKYTSNIPSGCNVHGGIDGTFIGKRLWIRGTYVSDQRIASLVLRDHRMLSGLNHVNSTAIPNRLFCSGYRQCCSRELWTTFHMICRFFRFRFQSHIVRTESHKGLTSAWSIFCFYRLSFLSRTRFELLHHFQFVWFFPNVIQSVNHFHVSNRALTKVGHGLSEKVWPLIDELFLIVDELSPTVESMWILAIWAYPTHGVWSIEQGKIQEFGQLSFWTIVVSVVLNRINERYNRSRLTEIVYSGQMISHEIVNVQCDEQVLQLSGQQTNYAFSVLLRPSDIR